MHLNYFFKTIKLLVRWLSGPTSQSFMLWTNKKSSNKEVHGFFTYTEENRPQGGLTFRKDTRVYHREGPAWVEGKTDTWNNLNFGWKVGGIVVLENQ